MKAFKIASFVCFTLVVISAQAQGPLIPAAAPGETMKTLEQVEPRTPISSAPFTISQSGSYYLTTNLTAGAGENGIVVEVSHVAIDLNGFTLAGSGADSGNGIYQSSGYNGLRVCNGTVMNWNQGGYCGIRADGANNSFKQITVISNYDGIWSGEFAKFSDCSAARNSGYGLRTGSGANLSGCIVEQAGSGGISAGDGSVVANCTVSGTSAHGITAGVGSSITRCSSVFNNLDGISAGSGSTVLDCSAYDNNGDGISGAEGSSISRCTAMRNQGDGIQVSSDAAVTDCISDSNGYLGDGAGIHVGADDCRIEGNTATDSDRGLDIDGTGTYVAGNTVRANTQNYDIAQGNQLNILLCEVPETIDWPCSVKFAGTLTCALPATNGIMVNADNVSIDLSGHALIGPGAGSDHGIYSSRRNLRVSNGSIVGWRGATFPFGYVCSGLRATGDGAVIESVQALSNRYGIAVQKNGVIRNCTAGFNASLGIYGAAACVVENCTSIRNGDIGITVSEGSLVRNCAAVSNAIDGIASSVRSRVSDSVAQGNQGNGINASSGCMITANLCEGNGWGPGSGAGIFVDTAKSGTKIDGNNVVNNGWGIDVRGVGNVITRNSASGNTTADYSIGAGNSDAQVLTPGSAFISTDPWANISF